MKSNKERKRDNSYVNSGIHITGQVDLFTSHCVKKKWKRHKINSFVVSLRLQTKFINVHFYLMPHEQARWKLVGQ